jgi:hypothetical protein
MNRWRVGEDRGSKETDGSPLTHMTLDEEDGFIQRIMANCDAAMAAAVALTTQMDTSEGTLVEREVDNSDFVRSSR